MILNIVGAVYSDVYTTSKSLSGGANVLEKVPYFEILQVDYNIVKKFGDWDVSVYLKYFAYIN